MPWCSQDAVLRTLDTEHAVLGVLDTEHAVLNMLDTEHVVLRVRLAVFDSVRDATHGAWARARGVRHRAHGAREEYGVLGTEYTTARD